MKLSIVPALAAAAAARTTAPPSRRRGGVVPSALALSSFLFALSTDFAAAASLLRGKGGVGDDGGSERSLAESVGVYLMAEIQYDGPPTGPETTDNIAFADGIIREVVNGPPGWAAAFASGTTSMQLPPGFAMTPDGKIDLRGAAPTNRGVGNPFNRDLEGGQGRRNLAVTEGDKQLLAVRVIAADAITTSSADEIRDKWFGRDGDQVNARTQFSACSSGRLNFVPKEREPSLTSVDSGVTEVTISETVSGDIRNAVTEALRSAGLIGGVSDPDYYAYCLPPGTGGSWSSYAYVNSWLSVFNDQWCNYMSAQMHELGHNLNLGHSGEADDTHGDQSGMMGYSYSSDDGPLMCFNAPKSWQLGWYSDKHQEVTASSGCTEVSLHGIADYESVLGGTVIVRIQDSEEEWYVSFNRKNGINSGTVEGGDQVLVHKQSSGTGYGYAQSYLMAKLDEGGTYMAELDEGRTSIQVTSISNGQVRYAQVKIGCEPTPEPTSEPTASSPQPTQEPTAAETAQPTAQATTPTTTQTTPEPTASSPQPTPGPTAETAQPTPPPTNLVVSVNKCIAHGGKCFNNDECCSSYCSMNQGQGICAAGCSSMTCNLCSGSKACTDADCSWKTGLQAPPRCVSSSG